VDNYLAGRTVLNEACGRSAAQSDRHLRFCVAEHQANRV
jgi:hypothetical protein